MTKNIKILLLLLLALILSSCGLWDRDNTPQPKALVPFKAEFQPHHIWSSRVGTIVSNDYLKMGPAVGPNAIYTASTNGTVTAIDKATGNRYWQTNTKFPLSATPGIGDDIIVVGSRKGDVLALQQSDGQIIWRNNVKGEILARPAVSHNIVIVKTVDGYLRALSSQDGHELWSFQQAEPGLILRGSSAPLIRSTAVIAGFENGNLAKLNLNSGAVSWIQPIATPEGAFAIQRMIDIDADPIIFSHHIFAATYQGKIASLDWGTGRIIWSNDISSYTGMTADISSVFVSDAKGDVWAFDSRTGEEKWRVTDLEYRGVTGPAMMWNYVVVGDEKGYLHWLSARDGHFAAREYVGAMNAAPVTENNVLYALTNSGYLTAYTMS